MYFFVVLGAMLNIVQDSALLEAIGCQMEMVRSIQHVIREYQLLFLCKLYSKISVLVFLKAFVCRFSSLIQQVLLEILSVLKFLSFRCLIKSLRDSVGEKFQLNSVFTPGQYLPKAFMSFAVLVNWLE